MTTVLFTLPGQHRDKIELSAGPDDYTMLAMFAHFGPHSSEITQALTPMALSDLRDAITKRLIDLGVFEPAVAAPEVKRTTSG